ncbi:exopolysaccharide biosynthesis protein [Serratia marcescens]|uniref:exopolysaccharide biosynthesis protein n=1 Tax=Serratia TaxID=613 RepID=UPI002362E83D|nr:MULTISPECIES: exopolysaccharide biosynthesis protein [Serratia]MDP8635896.1 exopolysaccharide biosynthesis protein [Serratia marcescens]MDP8869396.1 exopolysaccharide biosynthesis protein [Serratia marcescens]
MGNMISVNNISELRNLTPATDDQIVFLVSHSAGRFAGGGEFYYAKTDTTSTDNNGTVVVTADGARWKRLDTKLTFDHFGADPSGTFASDAAISATLDYVASLKNKVVYASENAQYLLTSAQPINVANGVIVKGTRCGLAQGPASLTNNGPNRASLSDDSAFIIKKPAGTICFACGKNVVFDGWSFLYPEQKYAATRAEDFIQYGVTLAAAGALSVANCRYVGAYNFVDARGEANNFENIYGWAVRCDYRVYESRDINRFTNVHVNANVTRPTENAVSASLAVDGSCAFNLDRHDNTFMVNVFSYGKKIFVKTTTQGTSYLGGLSLNNFMADRNGTGIDIDSDSAANIQIANGSYINDYGDAVGGFLVLRKSTSQSNITPVQISNVNFATANGPKGTLSPQAIRFETNTGYQLSFSNVVMPLWTNGSLNNDVGYNILRGTLSIAQRSYQLHAAPQNYLQNGNLIAIGADKQPVGWFIDGNLTADSNTLTANGDNPAYKGLGQRIHRSMGLRTFWAIASYIGEQSTAQASTGIWARSFNDDYTDTIESNNAIPWMRIGNLYYARFVMNNNRTIHDILINPGNGNNTVRILACGISPGEIFDFSPDTLQ